MVLSSFLRSVLFPTRSIGADLQKCRTSFDHFVSALYNESGLKYKFTSVLISK